MTIKHRLATRSRLAAVRLTRPLVTAGVLLMPIATMVATSGTAQASTCNSTAYGSWANNCTVLNGSTGGLVIGVQTYTNSWGCGNIATDGDFGQATYQAVKCYQGDNDLSVDGEVGPATWSAMAADLTLTSTGTTWKYYGLGPKPTVSQYRKNISTGEWDTRDADESGDWVTM